MFTIFGQFLDHDIGLTPPGEGSFEEDFPISIPKGDLMASPMGAGKSEMAFRRSKFIREGTSFLYRQP